ncbi:MAG: EAL domain-containing protein [Lyngbya sp.]|nr:EAL domain-containing protein [Lyngbya sp.]
MTPDLFFGKVPDILVADDTLESLRLISNALSDRGYDVRSVTNGTLAIASAQAVPPDLILLDIKMPDLSGYEVCQQLKQDSLTREIPVIFISALHEPFDKVEAFRVGGVDYITKPFQIEEVLVRIQSQLERYFSLIQIQNLNNELEKRVEQRTAQLSEINHALQQEITGRQRIEESLRESENKFRQLSEHIQEVFWLMRYDATLKQFSATEYVSPAFAKIWGKTCESLYKNPWEWTASIHPDDRERVEKAFIQKAFLGSFDEEYRVLHPDGTVRWIRDRGFPITDDNGEVYRVAGIAEDITDLKRAEAHLVHETLHDSLTGLSNRIYFMQRLEIAIKKKNRRNNYRFAVLFIDLDDFKHINDTLGHLIGDQLLMQISHILTGSVRDTDSVARLGGDEFTILLEDVQDWKDVLNITQRIQEQLTSAFQLDHHKVFTSASIGIVFSTPDYQNATEIVRDADIAMYRAKADGKGCYEVFDRSMYDRVLYVVELENALRQAIANQELHLYYQPIVSLRDNSQDYLIIEGFEVLARWHHPEKGLIPASEFISIAEDTGQINEIGEWVLQQACMKFQQLRSHYPEMTNLYFSINVSGRQLRESSLLNLLDRTLQTTQVPPHCLKLELTESSLIENTTIAAKILKEIQQRGIQISLDDFGTGFSSLRYLHQFPLNVIKIDRSFVESLNRGTRERCIIHSIITLARALGFATVAEGIETRQQLEKLRLLECESGQGYFFSKPIPGDQIADFLLKQDVLTKPAPKTYHQKHLNTFNTVSEQVRQVI